MGILILFQKIKQSPAYTTLLAIVLLLPLLAGIYSILADSQKKNYERSLSERAEVQFQAVNTIFSELQTLLQALHRYIELHPEISRQFFDDFITEQPITAYGIATFEWVPRVPVEHLDDYVKKARLDGQFDFDIILDSNNQHPELKDIFPIYYNFSAQMDGLELGKNLAESATWSAMLLNAHRQQSLQVGISEHQSVTEMRMALPVYSNRQQQGEDEFLLGFVNARIHMNEFIEVLLGSQLKNSDLCLMIMSETNVTNQTGLGSRKNSFTNVIYRSSNSHHFGACQYNDVASYKQWKKTFILGSQRLIFNFYDQDDALFNQPFSASSITLSAILLSSLMIVGYVYSSRVNALRIGYLVNERTQRLEFAKSKYTKLFKQSIDGIYRVSFSAGLLKVNPAFANAFGYSCEQDMYDKVHNVHQQLHRDPLSYERLMNSLKRDGQVLNFEWEGMTFDGKSVWVTENAFVVNRTDGEDYHEGSISVITERKKTEIELKKQVELDSLTGLLNRYGFTQHLDKLLPKSVHGINAVIFIDLDRFKIINDTLGHAYGDELLVLFSERLQHCFRRSDYIARFGGDEFAVFMHDINNEDIIFGLADRVLKSMEIPFTFKDDKHFKTSVSMGINIIDQAMTDVEEAIHCADIAMYEVKRKGRGHKVTFNEAMKEKSQRCVILALHLKDALENQELEVHFQPIVSLKNTEIVGFEALLRWRNPELGQVSPVEFIPIAEELDLITAMGDWVLENALQKLRRFIEYSGESGLFMNVNVSPKQLHSNYNVERLVSLLNKNQLKPYNLNLEITESAIHSTEDVMLEQLKQIKKLGIGIHIDDFGTGHSTLERLVTYPVDGIKIDSSFISQMDGNHHMTVVIEAILMIAKMLDLKVTAEGIEQQNQYELISRMGSQQGQGYLFSRPLKADSICELISKKVAVAHAI